jgi:ABC-type Fe3+-siderophore transport system permease subunit
METSLLAKFGAWFWTLLPAAVGSALSLFVGKEKTQAMKKTELVLTFLFGIAIAHWLGGATIEIFSLQKTPIIADAIKFTAGLIGMATLTNLLSQIPKIVDTLRKKYIGGD